jgi:uncharacterized membrane protein YqjE
LTANALTLLITRAEFATLELAQLRGQLVRWLLTGLTAIALGVLALVALSTTLTLWLWERFAWGTPAVLTLVYLIAAAVIVARLRAEIGRAPPLFSETLSELAKDRDALFGETDRAGPAVSPMRATARPAERAAQEAAADQAAARAATTTRAEAAAQETEREVARRIEQEVR